jgi:hypothetical protein
VLTTNLGIPLQEYDLMLAADECTEVVREALTRFMKESSFDRILLYGAANTGRAVKSCIGDRFAGFVDTGTLPVTQADAGDCVVITTSPVHVPEVEKALRKSRIAHLPVIRLFAENQLNIRLILETQPRCGTDYTMENLTRSLGLGYATVFHLQGGQTTSDGLIRYIPKSCSGYVVKSHFTNTLHYPQYRFCPTLFLLGYFPDTYYRWARMIAKIPAAQRDGYYLSADAPEWSRIKGYIPLHLKWLEYISDKTHIRYEDYFTDFEGIMDTFERMIGQRPMDFQRPRRISSRIYWTGDHQSLMDDEVWNYVQTAFQDQIRRYYPEKILSEEA